MKNKKTKSLIKNIFTFAIILVSLLILCGCGQNTENIGVDSIEISKKNLYMAEGQTAVISAQVYPFNASNQNYTFESNNESVVTIEDGFITAKKAGDAIIYVYSEDGGYKDSCNVLVTKARDNLALNQYNNLNMPPKELEPIYNSEDYQTNQTNSKTNRYAANNQNASINSKTVKNSHPINAKPIKQHTCVQAVNKKFDSFKTDNETNFKKQTFKDVIKNTTKKVKAEVIDNVDAGKNVFDEIKNELKNSIDDLENEKNAIIENFSNFSNNSFEKIFNSIRCDMINIFKETKQQILDDMLKTEEKIESGEYSVESKNLNGVTFVVIKNNVNAENDATEM